MKILAFSGSNSSSSINRKLLQYAVSFFTNDEVKSLDINDYEMPIYSMDRELNEGVPNKAVQFSDEIAQADMILLSLNEHNGAYSAAFKNIFDWLSRVPNRSVFQDKGIFLIATSPGARGGSNVLEMAKNRFPWNGGKVLDSFSLPSFEETFNEEKCVICNDTLREELERKIEAIKLSYSQK